MNKLFYEDNIVRKTYHDGVLIGYKVVTSQHEVLVQVLGPSVVMCKTIRMKGITSSNWHDVNIYRLYRYQCGSWLPQTKHKSGVSV